MADDKKHRINVTGMTRAQYVFVRDIADETGSNMAGFIKLLINEEIARRKKK